MFLVLPYGQTRGHGRRSPGAIGDIAKAALVLVQFEDKMIS